MTALDLDAIKKREGLAFAEMVRILSVGQQTRMSIPANPERDTDLIISASLKDIPALVAEVERQAKVLRIVRGLAEAIMFDSDAEPARASILAALDSNQPAASRTSVAGPTGSEL